MKCYACGEEAEKKVYGRDLCNLCYKVHKTANKMILKTLEVK